MIPQSIINDLTTRVTTFSELEEIIQSFNLDFYDTYHVFKGVFPQFNEFIAICKSDKNKSSPVEFHYPLFYKNSGIRLRRNLRLRAELIEEIPTPWLLSGEKCNRKFIRKWRARLHEELIQKLFHPKLMQEFLESSDEEIDPADYLN